MKIVTPISVADNGTFSRASTATYFDSGGMMQTAAMNERRIGYNPENGIRTNLLTYSEDLTNSVWGTVNSGIEAYPETAITGSPAFRLYDNTSSGTHNIYRAVAGLQDNTNYTVSVYVKPLDVNWVILSIQDKAGNNRGMYINIAERKIYGATGGGAPVTSRIVAAGNGWYRITTTVNTASGGNTPEIRFFLASAQNIGTYQPTVANRGVLISSLMLEVGNKSTDYISTAAEIRSVCDGSAEEIIERGSTNLVLNSDIEGTLGLVPTSGTEYLNVFRVSSERSLGLNGKCAKHTLQNADTNLGYFNFPVVAGNTYTVSAWVLIPAGYTNFTIGILQEGGGAGAVNILKSAKNSDSTKFGQWQRITRTAVAGFTGNMACVIRYVQAAQIPTVHFGTGFYSDCWQAELGDTATSYIPTTAVVNSRSADISNSVLRSNIQEVEKPAYLVNKMYSFGEDVQKNNKLYKSLKGSTSAVTLSIATVAVVTWPAHGKVVDDMIVFSTTGALPATIVPGNVYYIKTVVSADTFNISATKGGAAISTSGGTQSGVHTAVSSPNYNVDPAANPTNWLDMGYTNRWRMFDQSVQSQTSNKGSVAVTVQTAGYADIVALLNVTGSTAKLVVTHPVNGVVYTQEKSLTNSNGVTSLFAYFFKPIQRAKDVVFEGIPNYANLSFSVTVSNPNNTAAVGACIVGQSVDISGVGPGLGTAAGAKLGIQDYSLKNVDDFGNYTIKERAFSKRNDYTVLIANSDLDYVYNLFVERRAKPTLYIGTSKYAGTYVYGFYKDFGIDISYPEFSVASVTLESLT